MRITAVQYDVAWLDVAANCRKIENMLAEQPGSDLYVLPEMFATGFMLSPEGAPATHVDVLEWMCRQSAAMNAALCGSVAVSDEGGWYNRLYFVEPEGTWTCYDKRHLFTFANEHLRFKPGDRRVVVEWRGVRFLLQVCYDLRFPVFSRNQGDYDAAIFVANWPMPRRQAWNILLPARAIENQCFVVGVNRVGDDPQCHYDGGTAIIDPYGKTIASTDDNREQVCTADIDMDRLRAFRKKFPVLNDADVFTINKE